MQEFLKAIHIEKWCKLKSNNFRIEKRDWFECQEFSKYQLAHLHQFFYLTNAKTLL